MNRSSKPSPLEGQGLGPTQAIVPGPCASHADRRTGRAVAPERRAGRRSGVSMLGARSGSWARFWESSTWHQWKVANAGESRGLKGILSFFVLRLTLQVWHQMRLQDWTGFSSGLAETY